MKQTLTKLQGKIDSSIKIAGDFGTQFPIIDNQTNKMGMETEGFDNTPN